MVRSSKRWLLAGASAVAILAGVYAAQAAIYDVPGLYTFVAPSAGTYVIDVWGAQGGASGATSGGLGAGVGVDVTLSAGEDVLVYVGAQGGYGPAAGGGGGSSAALLAPMEGLVAGGGGGGGFTFAGGNGVPPSLDGPGGAGGGFDGGSGGIFGSPGQYGECRRPRRRYYRIHDR